VNNYEWYVSVVCPSYQLFHGNTTSWWFQQRNILFGLTNSKMGSF